MYLVLLCALGLVFGSFLGAWTWRSPRGIKISSGRSVCANCRKPLRWHENVPLVSYIVLGARCKRCRRKISSRYPLIEFSTLILFILAAVFIDKAAVNVPLVGSLGLIALPFLLLVLLLFWGIFIVDLERQIIPDEMVFIGMAATLSALLFVGENFYISLLSGLAAGLFLLIINLATRGRGMGMGDVKLAVFAGLILGPQKASVWLFLAFLTGAI
ncbi:MAG: Type 4 prepilin-like protein leader peptide-processing enzyme, partial [Parcubacteria group bacterium GW2011_GWB1_45_10]